MSEERTYIVIMAGGRGTRFWPRSRAEEPKQLLDILGGRTMLQETCARVSGFVPDERLLVVTGSPHAAPVREQLPWLPPGNIISEPVGRDTAACICLAATRIQREDPGAVMCVLPADHHIADAERFRAVLRMACAAARAGEALVTIGIVPRGPETGYGYIQYDRGSEKDGVFRVRRFHEKPGLEDAQRYIAGSDCVWNSGMFAWKNSVIMQELADRLPDIHGAVLPVAEAWGTARIDAAIADAYACVPSISIDRGVLEKADTVCMVRGDFGWNDIGSWSAVYDTCPKDACGNVLQGDVYTCNARGCLVQTAGTTVAVVGLDDVVVVQTGDALLVCRRDCCQDVRKIVEQLDKQGRSELL